MRANTNFINTKGLGLAVLSIVATMMLVVSWLATAVSASSVIGVTSNVADVPGGQSLILTITAQNDGDVYELEVDHSIADTHPGLGLPEFSVYADEADPYGGDGALFAGAGVTVTYNATLSQWVIDFGTVVTQAMASTGTDVAFYFVLKDSAANVLWGSMFPPSAENTFGYDLINGTGDSLIPQVQDDEDDAVVPGVPNTAAGN